MKARYLLPAIIVMITAAGILLFKSVQTPDQEKSVSPSFQPVPALAEPVSRAAERVIKKSFGTYVSPDNSPVKPERFTGYHTGTDFETLPGEEMEDVPVLALCDGRLLQARTAMGYGGVIVQSCQLGTQAITVVYGHIRLSSVTAKIGQALTQGQQLAVMGAGNSVETGGERKHLHLGIHKGDAVDIRGYVGSVQELTGWFNPQDYLK